MSNGAIFISAKSEDYSFARKVYDFLLEQKFDCFYSQESLYEMGQADYKAEIDTALESAPHIVVVTSSRRHVESQWVKYEWDTFANEKLSGRKHGNVITMLCGTMKPADLPIGLRRYQALSLETELERLPRFLGRKTPAPGSRWPPPAVIQPEVPDYDLVRNVAHGRLCKVWLACNAVGQWQAVKTVSMEQFVDRRLFEREFNGIKQYKSISNQHPGLIRVDFVSRIKQEGYFYYVLELADSLVSGWQDEPGLYRPCDLRAMHTESLNGRLPLDECAHIGFSIAEALRFLHHHKLAHGDVKPSNVLFVDGRPKLADIGLVAPIGVGESESGWIGTPGYLPPPSERRGTIQADIYGLGMLLYVISTGQPPGNFPQIGPASVGNDPRFPDWSRILLKACDPERAQRYATTAPLMADLTEFHQRGGGATLR